MSLSFLRSYITHPHTKRQPFRPLLRYLHWQYTARIRQRPLSFPFVINTILEARRGWHAVTACYYFGLPEWEAMTFIGHLLRPGDLFCDVGAHAGTYSILAASVGADVVAVEPHPRAAAYLRDHIAMNGLTEKVEVIQSAAGAASGAVQLQSQGQQSHIAAASKAADIEAHQQTLDDILAGRHPVALKIDVEGYEHEVLKGAAKTLSHPSLQAICIETMTLSGRYGSSDAAILDHLRTYGFEAIDYEPRHRTISPSKKKRSMSVLVRNVEWIHERVENAPKLCGHK